MICRYKWICHRPNFTGFWIATWDSTWTVEIKLDLYNFIPTLWPWYRRRITRQTKEQYPKWVLLLKDFPKVPEAFQQVANSLVYEFRKLFTPTLKALFPTLWKEWALNGDSEHLREMPETGHCGKFPEFSIKIEKHLVLCKAPMNKW